MTGDLSSQGARTGYCIDETATHLQLLTLQNNIINVPKPLYNENIALFDSDRHQKICYVLGSATYSVEWVCPVRLVILKNAYKNVRIYGDYLVTNPDGTINEELSTCKLIVYLLY